MVVKKISFEKFHLKLEKKYLVLPDLDLKKV